MSKLRSGCILLILLMLCGSVQAKGNGFVNLFNGKDLTGWTIVGQQDGYVAKNRILICPAGSSANLFTEKTYSDFIFRFQFKLTHGANNGVGIRAPLQGDAAYMGMEIQILDNKDPSYAHLEPGQYCGSIYKVAPAKRGALKPVGEWNKEEITANGRRIKVVLNNKTIVDANLNDVTDPETLLEHPGMLRPSGHVGFLGHEPTEVDFKDISIKDLSKQEKDNTPPKGFTALFNGKNLDGWKALVGNPPLRAKMTPEELALKQAAADKLMKMHWTVKDGMICYDGKNDNLCTEKDYKDFELRVDWKIEPKGDSGIYLRGSPQVQIWNNPLGSGGLYNNQNNPSNPLVYADNPPGQWNHFQILMIGDKVTVYLNNKLVTNDVTMENYWERDKPIYRTGQIELQHHWSPLFFKNIYIREINDGN